MRGQGKIFHVENLHVCQWTKINKKFWSLNMCKVWFLRRLSFEFSHRCLTLKLTNNTLRASTLKQHCLQSWLLRKVQHGKNNVFAADSYICMLLKVVMHSLKPRHQKSSSCFVSCYLWYRRLLGCLDWTSRLHHTLLMQLHLV